MREIKEWNMGRGCWDVEFVPKEWKYKSFDPRKVVLRG